MPPGEGWSYKSYGRKHTKWGNAELGCKEARSWWMPLGFFGGSGIAGMNEWGSITCNRTLCWSEKQSMCFPAFICPKNIPLHLLFHHRNPISEAFSHPLQRKITRSNTNRKQSHAMVETLPPPEITTFTLYVCDPPKHRQSSSVTQTHTFVCLVFANNLWCELIGLIRGNL